MAPVNGAKNMPRLRRSSSTELQTGSLESSQVRASGRRKPSVQDPAKFFRAIVEIERVRGLRVHPESPTMH
jgi:hypothetical protein